MKRPSGTYALFFWSAFIFVLFLNLLVWLYLQQVENQFRNELKAHLSDVEQVLSQLINTYNDDVDISLLMPGDESSLTHLYYRQPLEAIRNNSHLQSILLLSPKGEILIASPQNAGHGTLSSMAHNRYFKQALSGNATVSDIEQYAGESFMSAYAPVQNIDGFTVAVLVIEAKADFFSVLSSLKNRLLLFSLLNLILISLIALLLFRAIQRSMRYQAELKDQEHLVQLGTMAASVAHELRNPLGIIEGTNDVIRKKYAGQPDELFDYIPQEIKRLNGLIDHFLTFARTPQLDVASLDINELLMRLKMSLSESQRARLHITAPDSCSTRTDAGLLEQALMNLLLNAFQASAENDSVGLHISTLKKNRLRVVVQDNGPGIPETQRETIFKPFFTTKEKGTGLGLAITKRLISYLKGTLSLDSSPSGSRFVIEIPSLEQTK